MKVEICPLYDCCINKKQLEYCRLCDEFPCKIFTDFYDPSLNEEKAEKAILARKTSLQREKKLERKSSLRREKLARNKMNIYGGVY